MTVFAIAGSYEGDGDVHGPYRDLDHAKADLKLKLEQVRYEAFRNGRGFTVYDAETLSALGRLTVERRPAAHPRSFADADYEARWRAFSPPFPPTPPISTAPSEVT